MRRLELVYDNEFVADFLGEIDSFRVYKSKNDNEAYLLHVDFKYGEDILLKIKVLL